MKRVFLFVLLFLTVSEKLYAFDIYGLQPLAPNGVFSTFSAESLRKNKSSIEVVAERSNEPDFYRFAFKAAYGLTDDIEFNLTVPYVYHFSGSSNGMEDVAVGIKHRFHDEGKYGPSLAYLLNASIPSGDDDISTDGRVGVGLIISKRIGPFDGHLNLFYEKPGISRLKDEISLLGGVEFAAAHNFKILSEIIVKKNHYTHDHDLVEARFGYRIKTTDYIYTTIGAGFDIKKRSPEYRVFLSVNFTTPYEKKKIRKLIEEE
ncbi:MAG: hypothetical protein EHM54_01885 [Nitrospiraceae bacterium]|nr:MAG: hypothetical protein EHM54_01885 [Nitrospiraceae bacterium]